MPNHHARLKNLEKLAAIAKVKARNKSDSAESDRKRATVSELTNEELNARYQGYLDEIAALPIDPAIDPAIATLSTQELIEKYTQLCKEN